MPNQLIEQTLQITRECLDLVSRGEFDQYVLMETERRSLMDKLLQAKLQDLPGLQQVQEASLALQAELEKIVLAPRTTSPVDPYNPEQSGSGYSAQA